jgi:hypothetical protein
MKTMILFFVSLAVLPLTIAQEKEWKRPKDEPKNAAAVPYTPTTQGFPVRPTASKTASPMGLYGPADYFTLSNYGQPGVLIMGLGDEFNGVIGTFAVCHIWAIVGLSGSVNWGDSTPPTPMYFVMPYATRQVGTIKTPQQSGRYSVTATISGQCADWWRGGVVPNWVQATATAYVYESIPLSSAAPFQVNCTTSTPCPSIKGGQIASGVVTTSTAAINLGGLVRISVTGPGTAPPYIIETTGLSTVSFDIVTSPVTVNTPLMISVNSGGVTQTQTITVTP